MLEQMFHITKQSFPCLEFYGRQEPPWHFFPNANGFIRCRDTLGGVVPPPAGSAILSSAQAFLWCRKETAIQAVCPGESEQADQGPFSPSTG